VQGVNTNWQRLAGAGESYNKLVLAYQVIRFSLLLGACFDFVRMSISE
jgi:hypothetical protein